MLAGAKIDVGVEYRKDFIEVSELVFNTAISLSERVETVELVFAAFINTLMLFHIRPQFPVEDDISM